MATDDRDLDPAAELDAEPTAAERAEAAAFARLVDQVLVPAAAGRAPAVAAPEERALLEAATVLRATHGALALPAARQTALVEAALRQAIGEAPAARAAAPVAAPIDALAARRRRSPWLVSAVSVAVAAAAVAALWLRGPAAVAPVPAAALPTAWTSRPADALIGPIARANAADASARIDTIFADRLDGFRERTYARGGRP